MLTKEDLEKEIFEIVGYSFNILSSKQLAKALYEDSNIPIKERTSLGNPSTTEETLKKLAKEYKLPQLVLDYKKLLKTVSVATESTDVFDNLAEMEQSITINNNDSNSKTPKPGMPVPKQISDIVIANETNTDNKDDSKKLEENSPKDEIIIENSKQENQNDVGVYSSSGVGFSLSDEQKNALSIKKKNKNTNSNSKNDFYNEEIDTENEFSQNSLNLNIKKKDEYKDNNNKKSFFYKTIIFLFIIFFILILVLFIRSNLVLS